MAINVLDYKDSSESPCLSCPNHVAGIDKRRCLDNCSRLKAYQNGKNWTKEEVFIVPEGKDLLEDIERKHQVRHGTGHDSMDFEEPDNESEEIETDIEKIPGPVKYIPPEASWKKRLTTQGGGHKTAPEESEQASSDICVFPGCYKPAIQRNCCLKCYQRWRKGSIVHPTLGAFRRMTVLELQQSKLKKVVGKSRPKENAPKHGQKYETKRPAATDDICLTTININLELYPQIRDAVYRMAVNLSLPVSHIAVTLLGEALATRRKTE